MGVARRSSPAAMSRWGLFALCAAFRVVNAFVVRTYFNADEYWQSLSGGRLGGSFSAAIWAGDEKLIWQDGVASLHDLRVGEAEGTPLPDGHPLRGSLEGLVARAQASAGAPTTYDPDLLEQLKAAGYMEDGD